MIKSSQVFIAAVAVICGVLLFSGCGDDRADDGSQPSGGASYSPPTPVASAPTGHTTDPLLSGSGSISTADPLLSNGSSSQSDPLAKADPMQGRAMPTDHSHWLRGEVRDARLTVLVNGIRQGTYSGLVDQDITMRLRRGVNSVSFVYAPRHSDSSAQIDLVESEHDPPIPPLVSFQSTPLRDTADAVLPTTTRTFPFVAK